MLTVNPLCVARQDRDFVAVGCQDGIYVAMRGDGHYRVVLRHPNPHYICALPDFNKFLVHVDNSVWSYSLDLMARLSQGQSSHQALTSTMERVSDKDANVIIFRAGVVKDRTLGEPSHIEDV